MKKNITIKSNINKTVKIQYLHQNPNLFEKFIFNLILTVKNKKTHSKKSGKIAMKKKKLLNSKIQQNKYNEIFHKKIHYYQILADKKLILAKL